MHEQKIVIVICVNYFNNTETLDYIQKVFNQRKYECVKVIVVDNSKTLSNQDIISLTKNITDNSFFFYPETNLGYFNGAAWGFQKYLMHNPIPEWVIVSNTDIDFPDNLFFEKLNSCYPNGYFGIVAPSIFSEASKKNQNPYRLLRPTKAKMRLYNIVFYFYYIAIIYRLIALLKIKLSELMKQENVSKQDFQNPINIYAPHGSFIVFHRSYFLAGGSLSYGAFLYNEEMFVAETVKQLGQQVIYDPRLSVIHKEHATTDLIENKKKISFHKQSLNFIYSKFFK